MEVKVLKQIMAVVTLRDRSAVAGGVPVFYARDENERDKVSFLLSRILDGVVHDLENGSFIIVKH